MADIKKVSIGEILDSQIPEFLNEDSPLFKEFLSEYYKSLEIKSGAIDLAKFLIAIAALSSSIPRVHSATPPK